MRKLTSILSLGLVSGVVCAGPLDDAIERLGLERADLTEVTTTVVNGTERSLSLEFEGVPVTFRLSDASVRADGFAVYEVGADGVRRQVETPESRTVRGTIDELPGADVAGSFHNGRFNGMVILDDAAGRTIWGVEPAGETGTDHVVYSTADVTPVHGSCGLVGNALQGDIARMVGGERVARGSGSPDVAEIGLDADFNLFQDFGFSTINVTNRLELIMTGMNLVYERDVNITHVITGIVIRTSSATDPYNTNNPDTLLNIVRNQWAAIDDIPHDLAHMVSGRNFTGSTLGIAFLGTICGNNAVGANQHLNNFTSMVALISHEAGHNWNATHCNGNGDCHIMCAGLGGCNGLGLPNFGGPTSNRIRNFANGRPCINTTDVPYPFFEDFADGINSDFWPESAGVSVVNDNSAPSAPQVARLDAGEILESARFNFIGGATNTGVQFSARASSTSDTQSFALEYEFNNQWNLIGYAPATTTYTQTTFSLPQDARRANIPLRFRTVGGSGFYRVDNISFEPFTESVGPAALPFNDDFELAELALERWDPTTADVEIDPTTTNGQYAVELQNTQAIESTDLLAASLGDDAILGFYAASTSGSFNSLNVEYRDAGGVWRVLGFILGSSASDTFQLFEFTIPQADLSNTLRVRLSSVTTGDPWRVDDIQVSDESRDVTVCVADWNESGGVDIFDILAFLDSWDAEAPEADVNDSGSIDVFDILTFLDIWSNGCP